MSKVSEVNVIPIRPKEGLVALASVVIDEKFYIGSIGIYTKLKGGYRITYPNKKSGINVINIFHPITKELGDEIESAVIEAYEDLLSKDA
jgi:stage V sporulation protein G